MQNLFLPKKNYLIFGNLLKIAQISKKKIPKNFFNGVEVIIIKKIYRKIKKKAYALIQSKFQLFILNTFGDIIINTVKNRRF